MAYQITSAVLLVVAALLAWAFVRANRVADDAIARLRAVELVNRSLIHEVERKFGEHRATRIMGSLLKGLELKADEHPGGAEV
jgi:hypothetical protein